MAEDINILLNYVETAVKEGKKALIGDGVYVRQDYMLNLINRIRAAVKEATGEEIVDQAKQKAKEIIEFAEAEKRKLIDADIATLEAKAKADRIVQQAYMQKEQMQRDLVKNLKSMLEDVKSTVDSASGKIYEVADEAQKSLDSALKRINDKI